MLNSGLLSSLELPEGASFKWWLISDAGIFSFNVSISLHTNSTLTGSVVFLQLAVRIPSVVASAAVVLHSNCVNEG